MSNPFEEIISRLDQLTKEVSTIKGAGLTTQQLAPLKEDGEEIFSIKEAAAFIKKAEQTIYGYVNAKTIPHYKRNNSLYFLKSELIDWVKEGQQKTKAAKMLDVERSHIRK